jgi:hypothetical protein
LLVLLFDDDDDEDISYCDQVILSEFDQLQTNVALSIPPQWIEEARRPPLTWYGFLPPLNLHEDFMEGPPPRLLAPDYYESSSEESPTSFRGA